ncbi:hypothetical protein CB0940_00202 [Cercospora beticola]|uniref:DUF6590 domain-containing protein n=1 Tax=Cercospora beticola TaxID=122368 RepID=A0A2G5I8M3_CERBT|nr:hypothetical protein CB0940_00202 [Cercospora beticola]PIB01130.1 hypothetical protein CB0940_00202 [Cercospora beticola]WPA95607.1 hypothetical protein RHO25_000209 [Cercospora beticola]
MPRVPDELSADQQGADKLTPKDQGAVETSAERHSYLLNEPCKPEQQQAGFKPFGKYQHPQSRGWVKDQLLKSKSQSVAAKPNRHDSLEPLDEREIDIEPTKEPVKLNQDKGSVAGRSWRGKQGGFRTKTATTYALPKKSAFEWPVGRAVAPAVPSAPAPPANATHPEPALPLFVSSNSANYQTHASTGRTWRDFDIGDVFWISWTSYYTDPQVTADPQSLYQTRDGPKVTKVRLHVCVSKSEFLMRALPIFSHNNGGIVKIPQDRQYEFSCMKQVGDTTRVTHPLGTQVLSFESTLPDFELRNTSTVRLVESQPVHYDQRILKVGHLAAYSITQLSQQMAKAEQTGSWKFSQKTDKQKRDEIIVKKQASIAAVKTMPPPGKKL